MSNFVIQDGIPNYNPGGSTPTVITTLVGSTITTFIVYTDALKSGLPTYPEISATIISAWGGNQSNCYVSDTECSSFIETAIIDIAAWQNADWRARRAAMLEATRDVDSKQYMGGRYYYDQRLEFPRVIPLAFPWNRTASSSMMWSIAMERQKRNVQHATCWQTLHILRQGGRNKDADAVVAGIKSKGKAVIGSSRTVSYSNRVERLCQEAIAILAEWRTSPRIIRS